MGGTQAVAPTLGHPTFAGLVTEAQIEVAAIRADRRGAEDETIIFAEHPVEKALPAHIPRVSFRERCEMAHEHPRQFGAIAKSQIFPEVVWLHRPARNHRSEPGPQLGFARTVPEKEIPEHRSLVVKPATRANRRRVQFRERKALTEQGIKFLVVETGSFGDVAMIDDGYSKDRRDDVLIEIRIARDIGLMRGAEDQALVEIGSGMRHLGYRCVESDIWRFRSHREHPRPDQGKPPRRGSGAAAFIHAIADSSSAAVLPTCDSSTAFMMPCSMSMSSSSSIVIGVGMMPLPALLWTFLARLR